jgi:hypothetical protein
MDFQAVTVDSMSIDEHLTDRAFVGPETAFLATAYIATPRALIWHNPSSEWRLFVLLVPLASRLSLMRNPIFTKLVRDWGLGVRFIGVDAEQRVFDFRRLLADRTLRKLVDALAVWLAAPEPGATDALDVLFAALADSMLTILQERRPDWPRHLDREHRLEPEVPGSLFARTTRYPDFMKQLQLALRDDTIDIEFYGRALRSIDLRELTAEQRIASIIEGTLEPCWLDELRRVRAGIHLGCYNWLIERPEHARARLYAQTNPRRCWLMLSIPDRIGALSNSLRGGFESIRTRCAQCGGNGRRSACRRPGNSIRSFDDSMHCRNTAGRATHRNGATLSAGPCRPTILPNSNPSQLN